MPRTVAEGLKDRPMLEKFKGKGLLAPTLATLAALSVLVGLGVWQWQRKAWKEELIATIAARAAGVPLAPEQWKGLACQPVGKAGLARSCEFMPVRLKGRFDHAGERHVFTSAPPAPAVEGGPGYMVMTPFELSGGSGARIFVNRGFVPDARKDPSTRRAGQVEGEVEILGQIRSAEERGLFSGKSDPVSNVWFVRDPRELLAAAAVPSAPAIPGWAGPGPSGLDFYVDLIMPRPPGGLPAPRPSRIELPNRHLEYALTWWGLALTLIGVYAAFVLGRLRGRELAGT